MSLVVLRLLGLLLVGSMAGWAQRGSAQDSVKNPSQAAPMPKITVSKEVTWFTEPVRKDGFVSYVQAINQHHGKGVTAQNNSVVSLYQAMGPQPEGTRQPDQFFELIGIPPLPNEGKYFVELTKWWKDSGKPMPAGGAQGIINQHYQAIDRSWKEAEFPEYAAWLRDMETPLKLVAEASQRSEYYSPLVFPGDDEGQLIAVLLPGVQKSRSLARAMVMRAMWRLGEGKHADSWNDLMVVHRLGRLHSRGPTLIEWLVGVALENIVGEAELRFLSETQPTSKQIAVYFAQLQSLPKRAPMADKIDITERAMYLDCCTQLARGRMKISELTDNGSGDDGSLLQKVLEGVVLQSIEWDVVLKNGNRWYDRMAAAARINDYREQSDVLQKLDDEIKALVARRQGAGVLAVLGGKQELTVFASDVLISLILPAVRQAVKAEHRVAQRLRNLEVALALSSWRGDHGSYPKKLEELVPKYLRAEPQDIFGGQPLRYQRTAEGYLLYSVVDNEVDDDGRNWDDMPRGDDLVVRMPRPLQKTE